MREGLSQSWQTPLSLSLSLRLSFLFCVSASLLYLIYSPFCWHLLALFIGDSLSVFRSLSALVPLRLTPLCCHQSFAPRLSVFLCLIGIDRYRSHMSTNLIKSDKHRYFYRRTSKCTHSYPMQAYKKHMNPSTLDTLTQILKPLIAFDWLLGENHLC